MTHASRENEHPAITELRAQIEAAQEKGYTEGDVNHTVQPVIGHLRLLAHRARSHGGTAIQVDLKDLDHWVSKLEAACQAEIAWLNPKDPT